MMTTHAEVARPGRRCTKEGAFRSLRAVLREMQMMNVQSAIASESWSRDTAIKSLDSALNLMRTKNA